VARVRRERVESVRFRNVPAYVHVRGLSVTTTAGSIHADVAYGGAFYASVDVRQVGMEVDVGHLPRLIGLGREIKTAIEATEEVVHPLEPELRDVYGVIFFEEVDAGPPLVQRNVTIFADGEVDRSPCGSGTSARLALLEGDGRLERGSVLRHRSIVGSEFTARVVADAEVAGRPAVVTEVEGSAYLTGRHEFLLDPEDPLDTGFLLR
jgi:proline racemase/trans-L-3-hydroxyproline dehydratase